MRCVCLFLVAGATLTTSAVTARPLVAVIDSGIAPTAELRPHLIGEVDAAARPARAMLAPRFDHGTQVATILSRAARGQVNILSIRVDDPAGCPSGLNPPCQPNRDVIAWSIYTAVAHRADVINISMALMDALSISRAVAFAAWHGTQVVIAAGNDGRLVPNNLSHARAGYPNAVLVGALEPDGSRWLKSNRPATRSPDGYSFTWRWGARVPTALIDGTPTLASGTSLAAPIEAGLRARRRAAASAALVSKYKPMVAARRPVMLAKAVYPDFRSKRCRAASSPAINCLGSALIA